MNNIHTYTLQEVQRPLDALRNADWPHRIWYIALPSDEKIWLNFWIKHLITRKSLQNSTNWFAQDLRKRWGFQVKKNFNFQCKTFRLKLQTSKTVKLQVETQSTIWKLVCVWRTPSNTDADSVAFAGEKVFFSQFVCWSSIVIHKKFTQKIVSLLRYSIEAPGEYQYEQPGWRPKAILQELHEEPSLSRLATEREKSRKRERDRTESSECYIMSNTDLFCINVIRLLQEFGNSWLYWVVRPGTRSGCCQE